MPRSSIPSRSRALAEHRLPGIAFRPHVFEPTFQKYARSRCGGVQLLVTDWRALQPVRLGLAILSTVFRLYPNEARWREAEYEYVTDRRAIDLLLGEPGLREALEAGASVAELSASFASAETEFEERRRPWLLYP